jgi:phytoene dehydrogenase-like protein
MFTLHEDRGKAVDAIRPLSERDAAAFTGYEEKLARIAKSLIPLLDRTAPDPRLRGVRDLSAMARLAPLALRHRRDIPDVAYLFTTSAKQFLDEHFETDILKSALGWESISNTYAGPSTPGTAYNLLHEAASGGSGGGVGWGFVPGGMGLVTTLMAEAAREAGAIIRTGAEVSRIVTQGHRAAGVVLVGGEEIRGTWILSNADPKRTFLTLLESTACQPASSEPSERTVANAPA